MSAVADFLQQVFTARRNDHQVNAIGRARLSLAEVPGGGPKLERFRKILPDPLQLKSQRDALPPVDERPDDISQFMADGPRQHGALGEEVNRGVPPNVTGVG
jgi:hypothetical protein